MKAFFEKSRYIVREEGAFTYLDRLRRALVVRVKRRLRDGSAERARWHGLKDRFVGRRVFLLGNGPSLNRTPLHLLRNEYTMCFNRFNLMFERLAWRPSFYVTIDDRVLDDIADEVNREILPVVEYAFFPDLHPYNVDFTNRIESQSHVYWLQLDALSFRTDLPSCGINKTVANVGLQILAFLGFREIYMVGVDLDYRVPESTKKETARDLVATADDDPNHFDPRYFGKGCRYHQPRMEETFQRFRQAKTFFDSLGCTIVNAGVGGKLETFPRLPLRTLFNGVSRRTELAWLLEPLGLEPVGDSLQETFPDARVVDTPNEWNPNHGICIVREATAATLIRNAVFTHLPLGPYYGAYLFYPRKHDLLESGAGGQPSGA